MSAQRNDYVDPAALSDAELEAQEALPLPDREALSLLDPGLIGGQIVGGPTPTTPTSDPLADPMATQPSPDGTSGMGLPASGADPTAAPTTGTTGLAGQSSSDSMGLLDKTMPAPDASQPYQPTTSSSSTT